MLLGSTTPLFADAAASSNDAYRIGYAVGFICATMLIPGIIFVLLFLFRKVRSPVFSVFWALGLVVGLFIFLLQILALILYPELLEPPPGLLPQAQGAQQLPQRPTAGPCRLFIKVQEDAEVFVQDTPTKARGTTREFVSPPLEPGHTYRYKVSVRYRDAQGETVEEGREVPVRANTSLHIDFTRSQR